MRTFFCFLCSFYFSCSFSFFWPSPTALIIMVVTNWSSVGYHLVFSDDQVESRLWWVAGGSNHTFVAESPDECARAVMGVTPLSSLFSSLFYWSSHLLSFIFSCLVSFLFHLLLPSCLVSSLSADLGGTVSHRTPFDLCSQVSAQH